MKHRRLATFSVSSTGFGCMNLSHAYGIPPSEKQAREVLHKALDLGVTLFDTAALYGFGANEELLGRVLAPHRNKLVLASKCGIFLQDGKRAIDGRAASIKRTCEDSLRRLQTDVIDLYYLHRVDPNVPIEESMLALADLVKEGKIRHVGLSEVSAVTLRKANAIFPVAAIQSEYSLWTRNPEIAVLKACEELGVAFVAFSPLGRGFLTAKMRTVTDLDAKDIRRNMPRFYPDNFSKNIALVDALAQIALTLGCTAAQLSLAWLLAKSDSIIPIPGTTNLVHLEENVRASELTLTPDVMARLDALINQITVTAPRYNAPTQLEIGTEEF